MTSLSIKPGVRIDKLQPQMVLAIVVAHQVYTELGWGCVVTSGNDGTHIDGSLHYVGLAIDLRTRMLTAEQKQLAATRLRERLGAEFDVILESDHIHIEHQPSSDREPLS